tara:strand:- start:2208 stop:2654 length:447 start_codon:yes stop_codon:yes gene_type:complete
MRLISHRGNINGKQHSLENQPNYILKAIEQGYDVEIDIWYTDKFMLGHDKPQYEFPFDLLEKFHTKLWIHCKNIKAITKIKHNYELNTRLNYFWHEHDTITLTSKGYIWAYPGKQPIEGSIAVMPELGNDDISQCKGVCSDFIINYKK